MQTLVESGHRQIMIGVFSGLGFYGNLNLKVEENYPIMEPIVGLNLSLNYVCTVTLFCWLICWGQPFFTSFISGIHQVQMSGVSLKDISYLDINVIIMELKAKHHENVGR
jgi:hypothetical protein